MSISQRLVTEKWTDSPTAEPSVIVQQSGKANIDTMTSVSIGTIRLDGLRQGWGVRSLAMNAVPIALQGGVLLTITPDRITYLGVPHGVSRGPFGHLLGS